MSYKALVLQDPRIEKKGEYFVAYSDDLKLVCPGKTEKEALVSLRNTAKNLLIAMADRGVLEERMKELGIRIVLLETKKNELVPSKNQYLELVPA